MRHAAIRRMALSACAFSAFVLLLLALLVFTIPLAGCEHKMPEKQLNREEQIITLPMKISCTSLTVQSLATYDGPFMEDGSGTEVVEVAAVLLHNSGDAWIPYASVIVDTELCRYCFRGYSIPPKSTVLIPEASAQQYIDSRIVNVFGWHTVEKMPAAPMLLIQEQGDTTLCVRNTSGQNLENITIYFRKYIDEIGVGGKPYEFTVSYLPSGKTVTVNPKYYVSGYCRVVGYEIKTGLLPKE